MSGKKITVLGGGVGGIVTALELRKRLPAGHRVVLVDRSPKHVFAPSLLWLMTGERSEEKITGSLQGLEKNGVEVVFGEIEQIDPAGRAAVVDGSTIEGDYMVVSLGADLVPESIQGLSPGGHNLYTLEGSKSIKEAIDSFHSGRLALLTAEPVYKCPAAPYEAVMLLESRLRKLDTRERVKIEMYAAEPGPMGVAGPKVSAAVRAMVEQKGISYNPEHKIGKVDADAGSLSFENGAEAKFDLLAYVPPHRAPEVVREAGLTNESGWVPVDRHTLETGIAGVYAIGDVTTIPLTIGKPLPKAGVFAHGEAKVVAQRIAADIQGDDSKASFNGHGQCFLEIGDGRAGLGRGDFFGEPRPDVKLHRPGRHWHWGKALFERKWLRPLS